MLKSKRRFAGAAAGLSVAAVAAALVVAGCSHRIASAPAPAAPIVDAAATAPSNAPFEPFVLVDQPAPVPHATSQSCRILHIVRRDGQVYLADPDDRYYEAGRDEDGRLYPVYHDPDTDQYYPLYYDPASNDYYRVLHDNGGGYYRCYVGEPESRYYACPDDYPSNYPPPQDCPTVEYSGYSGPQYSYDGYRNWAPQVYDHRSSNDWLWAIPVIVGAYLLLNTHHYSSPQPVYYVQPGYGYHRPVIVRQYNVVNYVDAPVTIYRGGRQVRYTEYVTPPAGRDPVFFHVAPRPVADFARMPHQMQPRQWHETSFAVTRMPANAVRLTSAIIQRPRGAAPPAPAFLGRGPAPRPEPAAFTANRPGIPARQNGPRAPFQLQAQRQMAQRQNVQRQMAQRQMAQRQNVQRQMAQRQTAQRQMAQRQNVQRQMAQRQTVQRQMAQRQTAQRQMAQRQTAQRQMAQRQNVQRQMAQRQNVQRQMAQRQNAQRQMAQRQTAQRQMAQRQTAQRQMQRRQQPPQQMQRRQQPPQQMQRRQQPPRQMAQRQQPQRQQPPQRPQPKGRPAPHQPAKSSTSGQHGSGPPNRMPTGH